jgi:hypothetical protein
MKAWRTGGKSKGDCKSEIQGSFTSFRMTTKNVRQKAMIVGDLVQKAFGYAFVGVDAAVA